MRASRPILIQRGPEGSPSFALISVLALVSLAALTATAFLASARLERTATRPLGDRVRLEMALNIGLNCAKEIINDGVGSSYDNIATYWRTNPADDLGYLLLGTPRYTNGNPALYWYAAFSTATMTELATNAPPIAVMTNRITVTNQSMFSNVISNFMGGLTNFPNGSTNLELIGHTAANPRLSPPVGWILIRQPVRTTPGSTNTVSQPVMRFAFFVEDLSGLIDAERMCGNSSRNSGTNPTEVSMNDLGISFDTNQAARATYLTPLLLATNGGVATTNLRYFANGLRSWTNAIPRIPRCVAVSAQKTYGNATNKDGTKLLLDSNASVDAIASAITANLPAFTARAGAMNGDAYAKNIAANIKDYIDKDSDPTVDSANPPAWRGCELIAWPNEIFTRFHFETGDTKASGSSFQYSFKYKHYLEVWNICQTNVPLVSLILSNNRSFLVRIPPGSPFDLADKQFGEVKPMTLTPVGGSPASLKPGEFGMLESPTMTLRYVDTSKDKATNVQFQDWSNNSTTIYTTNSKILSATKGGQLIYNKDIVAANLYGPSNGVIFATAMSYACQKGYRSPPPKLKSIGGDPRAQLFLSKDWGTKGQLYVNFASPGGLNWENGNKGFQNGYVNASNLWADGGHYRVADLGENPKSYGDSPETLYGARKGSWSTNVALSKVANNGSLTNICELGNIFDPMQWEDSTQLPKEAGGNMPGLWTNLSAAAVPADTAGGRTSLRIGRPEFNRFAFTNLGQATDLPVPNMGQSAAALLDIFCTSTNFDDGGKINLNTAPGRVLAALAGGISILSDGAKQGKEVNGTMITAFTNGVMKFRRTYPFYSPSQLAFISTNYGELNWTNEWVTNTVFSTNAKCGLAGINSLNDPGREEWFAKIYPLTTVESRNFRIYVYAQMVKWVDNKVVPDGRVMRKYYQVYAEQTAEDPGTAFNGAGYSMIPERESEY